ncbi:MAG: HNH endonuclease signature motif containing protein, partial [Myxococcales bacterium]
YGAQMKANAQVDSARATFPPPLAELSDGDLLAGTRRLVGASNQLLASLLAHLAEVEARGVHRTRACSSLYTYCVYELRLSEDAAFRRVSASRPVRRFPALFDAIASGELHLTAVLMLGPHLTGENIVEVLARAKHRTKREIAQLVRELDPVPDIPARIEPLGPSLAHEPKALRRPTWEMFVRSFNPVRNLNPGERPRDWMDDGLAQLANDTASADSGAAADVADSAVDGGEPLQDIEGSGGHVAATFEPALERGEPALERGEAASARMDPSRAVTMAEVRVGNEPRPRPAAEAQRYSVQFTATAEHVQLVERAQALLSHCREGASLAEVHLRALRELVAALEKRKYGVGARPRSARKGPAGAATGGANADPAEAQPIPACTAAQASSANESEVEESPRWRGRHVPVAVRREVFARDDGRCGYVDADGQRCRETRCLELHHLRAFAVGGDHSVHNLTLRCRAHNALAAETDFGRPFMEQKRGSPRHESSATAARGRNQIRCK